MSGLAPGIRHVATTRRVLKLMTDTAPSERSETYRKRSSRLGYRPCAPAPVLMKPILGGEVGVIDAGALRDGERAAQLHRVGIAEVDPPQPLGHDHRVAPVGGEVHVVGVLDRDRRTRHTVDGVDRGQAVALVVGDPQRPQVVGRDDVLRHRSDRELAHDLVRGRIDLVNGGAAAIGDVDQRPVAAHYYGQVAGVIGGVDVVRIDRPHLPGARKTPRSDGGRRARRP
jgi:hypothetical protein